VSFSFDYYYDISSSSVNFSNLILNGKSLNLEGYLITWNTEKSGFFGNLVFELWIYNDAAGSFQYYEQSVELKLNILV
jgi:hypothetical protein